MPELLHRPEGLRWRESLEPGRAVFLVTAHRGRGFLRMPLDVVLLPCVAAALTAHLWAIGFILGVAAAALLYNTAVHLFGRARLTLSREGFVLAFERELRRSLRRPIDSIDGFDVAEVGAGFFSQTSARWSLRLLTNDGVARRLPILIMDIEHLRYLAARLNAELEALKTPSAYRS